MNLRHPLAALAIGVLLALIVGATIASLTITSNSHHVSRNLDPCPLPLTGKDASGTSQNFATQNDANNNCVGESAAYQAVQFTATLQSNAVANGNGTALSTTGLAGATVTVNCASCAGGTTVNFEAQEDGSDFVPVQGEKLDGSTQATTVTTAGVTIWQFNLSGVQQIRARISGYSAGTVTVTAHAIAVPSAYPTVGVTQTTSPWVVNESQVGGNNIVTAGVNGTQATGGNQATNNNVSTNVDPVLVAGSDYGGTPKIQNIKADSSGFLHAILETAANVFGKVGIDQTTPGTTNAVQAIPGTSGGTSVCYLAATASTNATNCKNAAGQSFLYDLRNTTSTIYYLRMYNSSSAPTCSSLTGYVESIPIPASSTGAGVVIPQDLGEAFSTGISFCVTGGAGNTDNTNAAVGVFVRILYK